MQERFDLEGEEVRSLLVEAVVREHESVDLYRFTSVLCREFDQDGRKRIVEMLWEVVMADGVVHEFESNLVWRTAELLGVSTRDRVTLRQAVAARTPRLQAARWGPCHSRESGNPVITNARSSSKPGVTGLPGQAGQ